MGKEIKQIRSGSIPKGEIKKLNNRIPSKPKLKKIKLNHSPEKAKKVMVKSKTKEAVVE
jgi:hypothetical protein